MIRPRLTIRMMMIVVAGVALALTGSRLYLRYQACRAGVWLHQTKADQSGSQAGFYRMTAALHRGLEKELVGKGAPESARFWNDSAADMDRQEAGALDIAKREKALADAFERAAMRPWLPVPSER